MTRTTNNWSLFGLDLTGAGRHLSLGFKQLLYDYSSPLLKKFDAPIRVFQGDASTLFRADRPFEKSSEQPNLCAVVLPSQAVLLKTISLPSKSEDLIDSAMAMEIALSSPFAESETRATWRVVSRSKAVIDVVLAITARQFIEGALTRFDADGPTGESGQPEVWALSSDGIPLVFEGFGNEARKRAYHQLLGKTVAVIMTAWIAVMLSLWVLAGVTKIRAERLDAELVAVRSQSEVPAQQREQLQLERARLDVVESAIAERTHYRYWLNHIAASAPDVVYFDQVTLEGNQVVVNGYANNASVYLRMLTETPAYSDVTALSAFARDVRTGLERFSIQWQLRDPTEVLPLASATDSDRSSGAGAPDTAPDPS